MTRTTPIEAVLIGVVEAVRHDYGAALKQRGLRMEAPKISVLRPEPAYTSEIRVDIVQQDTSQLVDCLEFFAFKDGKPLLTDEELRIWLAEQVAALAKEPP